jgi:hypothetical protein
VTTNGVELTRTRHRVATAVFLTAFALLLSCSWNERGAEALVPWSLYLISGIIGLTLLVRSLAPFRFHIGPDGLFLRGSGLNRLVRWHDFASLTLLKGYFDDVVVAVPGPGLELPEAIRDTNSEDEPYRYVILELKGIRENGLKVAEAMSRYGGGRFTDDRLYKITPEEFEVVPSGWRQKAVSAVVEKCLAALEADDAKTRLALIAEIEAARHAFPTARRGYLPEHVSLYLDTVLAELAKPEPQQEAAVED